MKKKTLGVGGIFFSILCSLLLMASATLSVLLLFLHALHETVQIPAIGFLSDDWLAVFLDSRYPFLLGALLLFLPLLFLLLINLHRIRGAFLCVGTAVTASALWNILLGLMGTRINGMLPGQWQDALVNATAVYEDFAILCGVVLALIGAACLSIYSSIIAVKGAGHETDA